MEDSDRIARLEERLAWFERHVVEQDRVMMELGEQVARLRKECADLNERGVSGGKPDAGVLPDERPPHY